ncbi:MAG: nucleoside triphosphate pyrophosphohydrolase [Oligoflexia bacterium]|nr:nucleoside triphosphate pyrophosphohydrolase [Oligoflexia bacterium]
MTKPSPLHEVEKTVESLRSENGCPWDKKQTFSSLRQFLLEECHETLAVLDEGEEAKNFSANLKEELGDLLLQILLHSQIAHEKGLFSFTDVCTSLNKKLIERHPHVFKNPETISEQAIHENWEEQKKKEKKRSSVLDDIPNTLPALAKSTKIIKRVSEVGFQWSNLDGPIEKTKEELNEFLEALNTKDNKKIKSELGDLIFCLSNLGFLLKIDAEESLREMLDRFSKRFRYVEKQVNKTGKPMKSFSLDELDKFWNEAKKINSAEELA